MITPVINVTENPVNVNKKTFRCRAFPIIAASYRRHLCCSQTSTTSGFCHVMWGGPTISSQSQERQLALRLCTQRHLMAICIANEDLRSVISASQIKKASLWSKFSEQRNIFTLHTFLYPTFLHCISRKLFCMGLLCLCLEQRLYNKIPTVTCRCSFTCWSNLSRQRIPEAFNQWIIVKLLITPSEIIIFKKMLWSMHVRSCDILLNNFHV